MNAKAAKVVRAYCNQIQNEGDTIILKDVKRRIEALPKNERGAVIKAMAKYLEDIRAHNWMNPSNRELRKGGKTRANVIEAKARNPILQMLAQVMGLGSK